MHPLAVAELPRIGAQPVAGRPDFFQVKDQNKSPGKCLS
jgi:hypothetical protein